MEKTEETNNSVDKQTNERKDIIDLMDFIFKFDFDRYSYKFEESEQWGTKNDWVILLCGRKDDKFTINFVNEMIIFNILIKNNEYKHKISGNLCVTYKLTKKSIRNNFFKWLYPRSKFYRWLDKNTEITY